jgi:hypothetical protein
MDPEILLFALGFLAAFVAGVFYHKHVVSEANAIKEHVTAEVAEVRADIASLLDKAKSKI